MKTFASILEQNRNIGPGFDFLRIAVALCIVMLHSWTVTGQYYFPTNLDATPVWMLHFVVVPVFFAISGFLTTASAGRLTLKNFLINRVVRIVPALSAVTLICALVIGPIFATVPLRQYYFSRDFATYFLNIIGWVHYFLPGVFATHAVSEVNGSLWTVPFEFGCYGLIAVLIVLGLIKTRFAVLAMVVVYMVAAVLVGAADLPARIHTHGLGKVLSVAFVEHEASAVMAFMLGIVAYQLRAYIYYSRWIFALCVVVLVVTAFTCAAPFGDPPPVLRFLLLPSIVYGTVFIGLTRITLPKFFKTGDYSYGIYLYHQPFLQIIISLLPVAMTSHTGALFTFAAGVPLSLCAAFLSWHLVEKNMLALRKRFSIVAKERGVANTAPGPAPREAAAQSLPAPH